jgi:glycosyltransferase involved in cell wall biosynthesis
MDRAFRSQLSDSRLARINNPAIVVSVILNYYAKESTVTTCLERLLNQSSMLSTPDELEIILVDDGTEGEELRRRLPGKVTYLWQRKMQYGICRAKNTGAKLANGKYLVFLDPDLLVTDTYIDAVLRAFDSYGDRVVYCGYIWDYHFPQSPDPRTEFGVWENPGTITGRFYQVAGGNMAIARSLFLETPGFDEELIDGGVEDLLFGYQVSQLPGTAICFDKAMEAWHLPHPPSLAHADVQATWDVVKLKYPDFYDQYIVRGLR